MTRRITEEQREKAWRMYEEGQSVTYIAKSASVSYFTAWSMTEGRKRGFKNSSEYQEHLAKERKHRPQNNELSNLIKTGLKEIDRNQSWLAEQIGVSRQMVSN